MVVCLTCAQFRDFSATVSASAQTRHKVREELAALGGKRSADLDAPPEPKRPCPEPAELAGATRGHERNGERLRSQLLFKLVDTAALTC